MKMKFFLFLLMASYLVFFSWGCSQEPAGDPDLSPAAWPGGELEKYAQLSLVTGVARPPVEGSKGIVAGTFNPLAIRSGLEALKKGGSAADAALTTALAQVTLLAGSNVSYGGVMFMVYYDAGSGKTHSLHAGWNTVQQETDPLSIPLAGSPSGRQVLVPGFMAGVQAAHLKFGKLPFASLCGPAIYFAKNGFIIDNALAVRIKSREEELARFPDTKKLFTKENGELYKKGDLFKQPQLAGFLEKIADEGADYMYKGAWAKKFVQALRNLGGKMTLKDLENYKAIWSDPAHTTYREYDIYSVGPPGLTGTATMAAFNLLELADLRKYGHYSRSAPALYQFIRISRMMELLLLPGLEYRNLDTIFSKHLGMTDFSPRVLASKDTARLIWKKMQDPSWKDFQQDIYSALKETSTYDDASLKDLEKTQEKKVSAAAEKSVHSDCVVVIDEAGNMAAILHSLNSQYYGFGLMVDGVSIADSASSLQEFLAEVKPGERLPDSTNPLIVLKKGKPFLASSSIGSINIATLQGVINVLDYNMDPQAALEMPGFFSTALHPSEYNKQAIGEGMFADDILEAVRALGQEIKIIPPNEQWLHRGYWVGVTIDPQTGKLKGGVSRDLNGVIAAGGTRNL